MSSAWSGIWEERSTYPKGTGSTSTACESASGYDHEVYPSQTHPDRFRDHSRGRFISGDLPFQQHCESSVRRMRRTSRTSPHAPRPGGLSHARGDQPGTLSHQVHQHPGWQLHGRFFSAAGLERRPSGGPPKRSLTRLLPVHDQGLVDPDGIDF